MIGNRLFRALWVIPLGFLVLAALPAAAQSIGGQAVAPSIQGGGISFAPQGIGGKMTLRVTGGEFVSSQSFRAGQAGWFAPVDREGFQLPDGTYNWEITVAADPRSLGRKALGKGEKPAHGRTESATPAPGGQRQSGTFTISNGVMVDSNVLEARSRRAVSAGVAVPQSAASRSAERSSRADDGIVAHRRAARAATVVAAPTAAQRAAEQNDRDGN